MAYDEDDARFEAWQKEFATPSQALIPKLELSIALQDLKSRANTLVVLVDELQQSVAAADKQLKEVLDKLEHR